MAAGPAKQEPPIKRRVLAAIGGVVFVGAILGGVGVATALSYDDEYKKAEGYGYSDEGDHSDDEHGDDHSEEDDHGDEHSGEDDH